MYTFEKTSRENILMGSSKIAGIYEIESGDKHSLFIGQVLTLFGEPDYVTESNENLCSWAVSAKNEDGNVCCLEIYYGPSGPAIGGVNDSESKKAADELTGLITSAKPTDFHYDSVYEDLGVKVGMGVKDGEAYYNSDISEEMFDELW